MTEPTPEVVLTDLVLIAALEVGNARIARVEAPEKGHGRGRPPCKFHMDLARFDKASLAADLEALAAAVRDLPDEPDGHALRVLFDTTALQRLDDRLRDHKTRIAAARRAS